jgi:transcriptional regulator with XRE-family HTH domain
LTLKQLAASTGLSVSFLSEIERGLAQPSMASLKIIRKALGVSLISLAGREAADAVEPVRAANGFAAPAERVVRSPQMVRRGQRKKLGYPGARGYYELLTPDLNRMLEVLYFRLQAGSDTGPEPLVDPPGEKCMTILSGSMLFRCGDEEYHLFAGDSLSYPADYPVSWWVDTETDAEGILVVTPPNF